MSSITVPPDYHNVKLVHAAVTPLVFALLMPIGAIMIRILTFRGILWCHAAWMVFSYMLSIIGLVTGLYLAYHIQTLDYAHATIGLIVICGCVVQPITGWVHHLFYKSVGRPNKATYPHIWCGRILITLGTIDGGLRLHPTRVRGFATGISSGFGIGVYIGYGVGAGIVWILWMGVILSAYIRNRKKPEGETGEKILEVHSTDDLMEQGDSSEEKIDIV